MISSPQLLKDLQKRVRLLEDDLRQRCDADPAVNAPLRTEYDAAKAKGRTAQTFNTWRDEELTQIAVAWILGCVFVRFLEDNGLIETPLIAGPDTTRMNRARDEQHLFFQQHPTASERDYLEVVFRTVGQLPAMKEFFDARHNPLWKVGPTGDGVASLLAFWRKTDPDTGVLAHDFTNPRLAAKSEIRNQKSEISDPTRFLGDLYQDLSESAKKRYALLQTPEFVEEFILDRTLTPAIEAFGYTVVRLIDPTCGSGHFLLGAFARLFRLWQEYHPAENPRVLAQRALDGVYGVDLNPNVVTIARFRLLLVALRASGVTRLKDAPAFRFTREGDAYTAARQTTFDTEDLFKDELAHFFETEDREDLHRILGRQYHAVVGNPPYITVKDQALNQLYRQRYDSCSGKYALSVPFMERFFDLALAGSGNGQEPSGLVGQITSNSFMKREFGKKLIEERIPRWDLTHVVDTSGAYIPGHGTPTVILFGRNAKPESHNVRTVMGIKGEPSTPDDPAHGQVWSAIINQVDRPGSESEFVSAADTQREKFHRHPWSIGGGGAAELKEVTESGAAVRLSQIASEIGITSVTGEDDLYLWPDRQAFTRVGLERSRQLITGDLIRDWDVAKSLTATWLYDPDFQLQELSSLPKTGQLLWVYRAAIARRKRFGTPMTERGLTWYEWQELYVAKLRIPPSITFAFVATHNHFVLDRGGKVFNRSAPVIKLKAGATEDDHLRLLGLLNSSAACFWMKQVFHCKGSTVDQRGARQTTVPFEDFYEYDGTKLKQFPVPTASPLCLAGELDRLARELSAQSPDALAIRDAVSAAALADAEQQAAALRARMISLQEELDWQCYRLYGLIDAEDDLEWPEDRLECLPPLTLGERAFEIRMARQMSAGELETTWFERHKEAGSRPITELPAHWPAEYRALVERRLAFIESNKNINLIERPECKRRWNTEPWAKRQQEALRKWLLLRLEGYFFDSDRMFDRTADYPADADSQADSIRDIHGIRGSFLAGERPSLVSVNQLAEMVQAHRHLDLDGAGRRRTGPGGPLPAVPAIQGIGATQAPGLGTDVGTAAQGRCRGGGGQEAGVRGQRAEGRGQQSGVSGC